MVISFLGQLIIVLGPVSLPLILLGTMVRSVGFGCMGACMFAMATDAIEYGHWFTGHRAESTTYSAVGIGNKVGVMFGSGILSLLLGAAGYDGELAVQSESAMDMIRFLYLWVPAILAIITIAIMFLYKLDRRYDSIMEDLRGGKYYAGARYAPETNS